MKKKNSNAGWYHYSSMDGFDGIKYLPLGEVDSANYGDYRHQKDGYGPFKTWGEAKADALDFYRTDRNIAMARMRDVRGYRKVAK